MASLWQEVCRISIEYLYPGYDPIKPPFIRGYSVIGYPDKKVKYPNEQKKCFSISKSIKFQYIDYIAPFKNIVKIRF